MGIERVIEIEYPSLDRAKAANVSLDLAFNLTLDHSRRLVAATLAGEDAVKLAESVIAVGQPGAMMQKALRRSVPFVQAVLIGTLAAAALAGFAMLISHSRRTL